MNENIFFKRKVDYQLKLQLAVLSQLQYKMKSQVSVTINEIELARYAIEKLKTTFVMDKVYKGLILFNQLNQPYC